MSNHIDHIEITNFKSIRHAKIEGCKRINVFIGYPNVGKSAILEAISALSYIKPSFKEPFHDLCRLNFSHELFFNANVKQPTSVKSNNGFAVFSYINESNFTLDTGIIDEYIEWIYLRYINYSSGGPPFQGEFFFDTKSDDFIGNTLSNTQKDILDNVLPIKKYTFKSEFNNVKTNGLNLFSPYGENLVDIVQSNISLRKEVAELFKTYNLKLLIDQATNSIRGLKQLDEETIFTIPFYQMADTLQRLIFHKAAIMSNENAVLLFEEPEAHMFPPYISKFTGDIIFNKENGNQYFINTHSPFVMNDFMEDARDELSIYLVGLKNGETTIKRLSDEDMHKVYQYGVDLFYNIESYLD